MEDFPRPVTMMIVCTPELMASSTPYWIRGLSTKGSISFGWAFVAGRNLVPSPAAGNTALRTFEVIHGHCTRLNLLPEQINHVAGFRERVAGQLRPHSITLSESTIFRRLRSSCYLDRSYSRAERCLHSFPLISTAFTGCL